MRLELTADPVPPADDAGGVLRVAGTRVRLATVVGAFRLGATAEEVAPQYPALDLAAVYDVIAFYLRRRPEVDAHLAAQEPGAADARPRAEAAFDTSGLRERLVARHAPASPHVPAARPVVRFLADGDFNSDLLRALRRCRPQADVVRVQDVGLSGRADPAVLAWAGERGRVVLTHDAATLVGHALARLGTGDAMAGVLVARQAAAAAAVGDDREPIAGASPGQSLRSCHR